MLVRTSSMSVAPRTVHDSPKQVSPKRRQRLEELRQTVSRFVERVPPENSAARADRTNRLGLTIFEPVRVAFSAQRFVLIDFTPSLPPTRGRSLIFRFLRFLFGILGLGSRFDAERHDLGGRRRLADAVAQNDLEVVIPGR
jgi:hypothetical protein